jgi:hypothetical protein
LELAEDLSISTINNPSRAIKIQPCCALKGDGLMEGFLWAEETYLETKQAKAQKAERKV